MKLLCINLGSCPIPFYSHASGFLQIDLQIDGAVKNALHCWRPGGASFWLVVIKRPTLAIIMTGLGGVVVVVVVVVVVIIIIIIIIIIIVIVIIMRETNSPLKRSRPEAFQTVSTLFLWCFLSSDSSFAEESRSTVFEAKT